MLDGEFEAWYDDDDTLCIRHGPFPCSAKQLSQVRN